MKVEQIAPPLAPAALDGRITIERAIQAFTREYQEHAARNTQKKFRPCSVTGASNLSKIEYV
jgi:hypothetical protein